MRLKSYAAHTHQGPYLQINEDGYDFDFENELYVIFDGFGGSGIGDRAVEKLKHDIKFFYSKIASDPNATMPLYYNPRNLLEGNALTNALMSAHQNLLKVNHEKPLSQKAGASVIALVKSENILILAGVGNCVAYHFREGKLKKLFLEDSFHSLSKESANQRFYNSPLNALGMYPELGPTMKEVRLAVGDKIVLLTDGVYGPLREEEILYALNKSAPDAQERINSLLKLSNDRGNLDNQTAMILEY